MISEDFVCMKGESSGCTFTATEYCGDHEEILVMCGPDSEGNFGNVLWDLSKEKSGTPTFLISDIGNTVWCDTTSREMYLVDDDPYERGGKWYVRAFSKKYRAYTDIPYIPFIGLFRRVRCFKIVRQGRKAWIYDYEVAGESVSYTENLPDELAEMFQIYHDGVRYFYGYYLSWNIPNIITVIPDGYLDW